jgi:broad specificity phosphatase PhoE
MQPSPVRHFARVLAGGRTLPPFGSVAIALTLLSAVAATQALPAPASAADAKGKVTIYLIRHGETDWNQQGRVQGNTDNPLNAKGREQAASIASQLQPITIDHIYSSGLVRAVQTAEAFKGKAPITPQPLLNERSRGIYEGKPEAEVAKDHNRRAETLNDDMDGGETLASAAKRIGQATREIVGRHVGGTIMIVGHGGVNPLIVGELAGLSPERAAKDIRQGNDEVYKLEVFGNGSVTIWKLIPESKLDQL